MLRESIATLLSAGSTSFDARVGAPSDDSAPGPLLRTPAKWPTELLLQDPENYAASAMAAQVEAGKIAIQIVRCRASEVARFTEHLRSGRCLPIGNAEFVRRCFAATRVQVPAWSLYPRVLATHMVHQPRKTVASRALASAIPVFVKAVDGKPFRGFVLDQDRSNMKAGARMQLERLLDLPRDTPVWVSEPLPLLSEWRYYVTGGEVIGYARSWPANLVDTPSPAIEEVSAVVAAIPKQRAYALDFGVLPSGQSSLLAVRDAWGIDLLPFGLYAPAPLDFMRMLWGRWQAVHMAPASESSQ